MARFLSTPLTEKNIGYTQMILTTPVLSVVGTEPQFRNANNIIWPPMQHFLRKVVYI